jgi:hypothetical protein
METKLDMNNFVQHARMESIFKDNKPSAAKDEDVQTNGPLSTLRDRTKEEILVKKVPILSIGG